MSITYQCVAQDAYHYAQALTLDANGKRLMWETLPGQGSLLVQTPYGRDPIRCRDEADAPSKFDEFSKMLMDSCPTIPEGSFQRLNNGFWVRYVSAPERVRNDGCLLNGEACTYTVFPCDYNATRFQCTVYVSHGRSFMAAPYCDVPMKLRIAVAPAETYSKRFFFSKPQKDPLEFYAILFKTHCGKSYQDGDIEYCVDERWRIPITRKMFHQQTIFVRTRRKPTFRVCNAGFELILLESPPLQF